MSISTGLSQKLPACQPQHHKPAAPVTGQGLSPDPRRPGPAAPAIRRLSSDDWGEFSGAPVVTNSAGVTPFAAPSAAPAASELGVNGTEERLPVGGGAAPGPARERSVFSDSDSDSEGADRFQNQRRQQKSTSSPTASDGDRVQLGQTTAAIGSPESSCEKEKRHCEGDVVKDKTIPLQNGTKELPEVAAGGDSDGDDFGDFGSFSAATASDQFKGWSEPVTAAMPVTDQTLTSDSSVSGQGGDSQQSKDTPSPVAVESCNGRSEDGSPCSDTPASNAHPPDEDFGGFIASNGAEHDANDGAAAGTSEGSADRLSSPAGDGKPGDASGPSELADAAGDAGPGAETSESGASSSLDSNSPQRAKTPGDSEMCIKSEENPDGGVTLDDFGDFTAPAADQFGDFAAPAEDLSAPMGDSSAPIDDFGGAAAPADDFGDFSAPAGDFSAAADDFGDFSAPGDDFGDFAAPSDDFGDFSVPAASSGGGWPPDGSAGGGGSGGFADFGSAFDAPTAGTPLEATRQLADPADLSEDDFGDFEDFQAPAPKESTAVTDEVRRPAGPVNRSSLVNCSLV